MSVSQSPEADKKALLAKMQASRATYAARFLRSDSKNFGNQPQIFPRSHFFRTLTQHPYLSVIATIGLVALGPRRAISFVAKSGILFAGKMWQSRF